MSPPIRITGEVTGVLSAEPGGGAPITVIGVESIRQGLDARCLQQARNARLAPGVSEVVLNPDAHVGYGAPVGCVMASPSHIYPGPVGVDIKCSMSLLQTDIDEGAIAEPRVRRALIQAVCERTPTGAGKGQRSVKKARRIPLDWAQRAVVEGASPQVCRAMGIPEHWAIRCEDSRHRGHDGTEDALALRWERLTRERGSRRLTEKLSQLGSFGGGNHFGEAEIVDVVDTPSARESARVFGLEHSKVAFLSHCGSRGLGHDLASGQFKTLQAWFEKRGTPYPAHDPHLVYAPLGSAYADAYLDDMALAAHFATLNHLLINALVLEAFQEVLPGTQGDLVYFISHNIARQERLRGRDQWVHRKGATRAFPARHPGLAGTPFYEHGHPILLPGNPRDGSAVMVGLPGAEMSAFSINHGAGRRMGRRQAFRELNQAAIDREFHARDLLSNCRAYPRDEAPDAYKDFGETLRSVEVAGLARRVAGLRARFVIKDGSQADD